MSFPITRMRRLRRTPVIRRMLQETELSISNLIYPLFVRPGKGVRKEISSMPEVFQYSPDTLLKECAEIVKLGIPAVILFGIPSRKDKVGKEAYAEDGIIQETVRAIKKEFKDELVVITDVCLCEYTDHGHCGVVNDKGVVDNDATLKLLSRMALMQARSGVDIVAPSDMMDGRVQTIRQELDRNGFSDVLIMSYAAKFASSFYGPFREAAESTPEFGDRKSYQMNPANAREARREVRLDIQEGADIVMVKPALPYLDIISQVRQMTDLPLAAYNVSGEYAMLKAAASKGWLDEEKVMMEMLTSIKRAGANLILTYFAKRAAQVLR